MGFYKDTSGLLLFFLCHIIILSQVFIVYETEDVSSGSYQIFHKLLFFVVSSLSFYSQLQASFTSPGNFTHNSNPGLIHFFIVTHGIAMKRGAQYMHTIQKEVFDLIEQSDDESVSEFDETEFEPVTSITEESMAEIAKEYNVTLNRCSQCYMVRPLNVHHCSSCHCCILNRDHHCPWINNCVGQFNHKFFLLFMLYSLIGCSESLFISCYYALYKPGLVVRNLSVGWIVGVFIQVLFSVVFIIFIICLLKDQKDIIDEQLCVIDKKQRRLVEKREYREILNEIFGDSFGLNWFLPFKTGGYEHLYRKIIDKGKEE